MIKYTKSKYNELKVKWLKKQKASGYHSQNLIECLNWMSRQVASKVQIKSPDFNFN